MPKRKQGAYHTAGLEQVRALSHPLRLRLLELFAECPRTTKQAAEVLGEAPTRLYHHVAALERAGLVRLKETRRNRGTTEKYFEAVAHRIMGEPSTVFDEKSAAAVSVVLFDQAREELVRALASGRADPPNAVLAIRGVLRLSKREATRLRKELLEVLKRIQGVAGAKSRSRRERYSLTVALLPTDAPPERTTSE
jgi:DNA-binding transcriptional ArsR family regulator